MCIRDSQNALSEALGDACNMELVQSIHDRLRDQIEQHKESHAPEPLELSVSDAAAILRDNGVEEEKILVFRDSCATQFGDGATLNPANLIDSSRFEAVSYTHLDVYKRQVMSTALLSKSCT